MSVGVIGGQKGGVSKTTLAVNIAAWLATQNRRVLLVDADEQGTANLFAGVRAVEAKDKPHIRVQSIRGQYLNARIDELQPEYDDIIIDTSGEIAADLKSALTVADWLLTPLRTGYADAATALAMNAVVGMMRHANPGLRAHFCLTHAFTNDRGASVREATPWVREDAPEFTLLETATGFRKAWHDCIRDGRAVFEAPRPDAEAVRELMGIINELGLPATLGR